MIQGWELSGAGAGSVSSSYVHGTLVTAGKTQQALIELPSLVRIEETVASAL